MPRESHRPSWVIEQLLNTQYFKCCGDQDLFPFKCRKCGSPLVLCYECDTLYNNLHILDSQSPQTFEIDSCPKCGTKFPDDFMRSTRERITFSEWHAAGLDYLLIDQPISKLFEMLTRSADQIAESLRRGKKKIVEIRVTEYQNLAESLSEHFPSATEFRNQGCAIAQSKTLSDAMKWHSLIPNICDQAYALLGITDVVSN